VTISNTGLVDPIEKKLVKKKKDRIMIAWVAYQRRVESLSRYCDLNVYYIHYKWEEKSKLYKPLSYIFKMVQTAFILFRTNAKIVFIQLPPTFPLYILVFYCWLQKAVYICDCHNTTFYDGPWIKFPFAKKMLRNSAVVLVHNEDIEEKVKDWGFPHMLLRDPIPQMSVNENIQTVGGIKIKQDKYVIFPGSFGTDEPLEELFDAMRLCPEVLFACTWFSEKLGKEQQKTLPANLRLTGFLDEQTFTALYANAAAAIVLTTREGTQPSGAAEAVSLCVPLIISDIATTRRLYSEAGVFVKSTSNSIAEGVNYALSNQDKLRMQVRRLKEKLGSENNDQLTRFQERLKQLEDNLN